MQHLVQLARIYPLSTLCFTAVWLLSFLPFPEMEPLEDVPFADKWTHIVMYGGSCGVLWTEYMRHHLHPDGEELLFWAWLLPIVMSGIIELLQQYCTTYRSGDWIDMAANIAGVSLAAVYGLMLWRVKTLKKG